MPYDAVHQLIALTIGLLLAVPIVAVICIVFAIVDIARSHDRD